MKTHDTKRHSHANHVRDAVHYLHGRFELETEYYCFNKGIDPLEVTPLVGAALSGTSMDHLSALLRPAREAHPATPALEVAERTPNRRAQTSAKHPARKAAQGKVKRKSGRSKGISNYWKSMTAAERAAEMKRRVKKREKTQRAKTAAARPRSQQLPLPEAKAS